MERARPEGIVQYSQLKGETVRMAEQKVQVHFDLQQESVSYARYDTLAREQNPRIVLLQNGMPLLEALNLLFAEKLARK